MPPLLPDMVIEIPVPNGFIKALGLDKPNTISVNCDIRDASKMAQQKESTTKSLPTKDEIATTSSKSNNSNINRLIPRSKPIKRYYIDELGFYRYLDYEQKQYVCSNVSMINSSRTKSLDQNNENHSISNNEQKNGKPAAISEQKRNSNRISSATAEVGLEVCFKTVRHDLGISHFDKTEDYENWKRGWDEFMRVKLISQQPVTLNRELKNRVRSGIPHDYRCKVWTALIRMRTRNIRAMFGEDIYDVIISDYVSKIGIPDYSTTDQKRQQQNRQQKKKESHDSNNNNNNNNTQTDAGKTTTTNATHLRTKMRMKTQSLHDNPAAATAAAPIVHKSENGNGSSFIGPMTAPGDDQHASQRALAQEPQIDKCFKQIELDLLRTLPNNRHFENPNSIGIKRVRRVLRAYACFNQEVSYCQGMNRLAAMALLVLPEEEAFWCLVAIIQCIMPRDYYLKPWLAQVDCCVLSDLLEKKLPKLHKHLVSNDIQLTLFSWFFTIFVDGFRPELMLRIWDCFLLEGDKVLFRFALAILHITQDELLNMNDFSTMSSHLSRLVSTRALDVEQLFEAFNTMNPLSTGALQARREFHRRRMRTMLED